MEKNLELSFHIYNHFCLKEFKREDWNIMSNNDLYQENCSILENILYFLDTFETPLPHYPDPFLSIDQQTQHLLNILLQYYSEIHSHNDIQYIQKHPCSPRKKDISILLEKLNIWVYIYNNCEESWYQPDFFSQEPRKVFFLYQKNEHHYFIMFPKKITPSLQHIVFKKPSDWDDFKSFLPISPPTVKFYQKVVKNYCFKPPSSIDWHFISSDSGKDSILECILLFFYSMKNTPSDLPIPSLSWKEQIHQLRKTILHSYNLLQKKVPINEIEHGYLKKDDIFTLLNRNGIWLFTYVKNNFSPSQEGLWDIPHYTYIPKGILFLFKKNQDEYSLLSPRKDILEFMIKKSPPFYENIKHRFLHGETSSSDEQEQLLLMDNDNPYTGKKEVWNFSQHLRQFIRKNIFLHTEKNIPHHKSLLLKLNSIQNLLPTDLQSDRKTYIDALLNNNYRSKIQKIIYKFQEKFKNIWVYIFYPDKDIDSFKSSTMNFPKHILFIFKRNNTNVSSNKWNKKEFYFVEFQKLPENFKSYVQDYDSSSKDPSPKSSSSKVPSPKSSSSKDPSPKSSSSKDPSPKSSSSKDYNSFNIEKLKSLCRQRKIPLKSYKKSFLIQKLNQYDKSKTSSHNQTSSSKKPSSSEKLSSSEKPSSSKKPSSSEKSSSSKNFNYNDKSVKELIKLCRERRIPLNSYKKTFLIQKLLEFDTNPDIKLKKTKSHLEKFKDKLKKISKKK